LTWIAGVTLVAAASAAAFSWVQAPVYKSAAEVVVLPLVSPGAPSQPAPEMATEKELVTSDVVASIASRRLSIPTGRLRQQVSVTVPADAQMMEITCSAADPPAARACAQEISEAYVQYKDTQPISTVPERARIVTPAPLPLSPSAPDMLLNIAAGLLVGLVLGLLTALLRDRLDDRIRGADDLERRGLRVLGTPTQDGEPMRASTLTPNLVARSAETYGAISEKVLRATLSAARPSLRQRAAPLLVLTGVETDHTRAVTLQLATALACAGDRVVLVDADTQAVAKVVADLGPGLLDILTGRTSLAAAMGNTPVPTLTLIKLGGRTPEAAVQVGTRTWTETATALTESFDHVIVAAAPLLASADAARILQPANAVILVVADRHTTRRTLDRTIEELGQLATPVVGAVLATPRRRSGGFAAALARRREDRHPQKAAKGRDKRNIDELRGNGHAARRPWPWELPDADADRSLTRVGNDSG
jgi:capsular polysaccharide biosynthesis protein/Mrp family chromosome partitioning ATPase